DAETGTLDGLQVLLGDHRIGVDVGAPQRRRDAGDFLECLHDCPAPQKLVRMSTKCPAIAAAAAMAGLTRWVRPPLPWRPSKLRLDVEAHRSPGSRRSAFIARHIEQPASRHSKPASLK